MVAVPFGLRLATDRFGDRDPEAEQSAAEKLADLFGDGRAPVRRLAELAMRPLSGWTPEESAAQPVLFDWLTRHEQTILPWEWSSAAKAKDRSGYCATWISLLDELARSGDRERKALEKARKRLQEELAEFRGLSERLEGRLHGARADLATNGLPTTVIAETVRRGRLWGFNRKEERRAVKTPEELRTSIGDAEKALRDNQCEIVERETKTARLAARLDELADVRERLAKARGDVEGWKGDGAVIPPDVTAQTDALLECVVKLGMPRGR